MVGVKGHLRLGIKVRPACRNSRISRDGKEATCVHLIETSVTHLADQRLIAQSALCKDFAANGVQWNESLPYPNSTSFIGMRLAPDACARSGSQRGPDRTPPSYPPAPSALRSLHRAAFRPRDTAQSTFAGCARRHRR